MSRHTCSLTVLAGSIVALALAGKLIVAAVPEPVRIDAGHIAGVSGDHDPDVRVFKAVPFAAPPVKSLRWRPPQPVRHWDGVRKADQFAPGCLQPQRTGFLALIATSQRLGESNEDCLYLNIWTAAGSERERRPVMVWFPGGGFTTGGASALVFDGEALARKGVVVVTTNYRLGIFGFFAHPELNAESASGTSGNYGLMDQIAALKWVQRNIAAFGGDPNRVTIFGQSAGAVSVFYQMASPLSKGLFQRAIGESGGGTSAATFGVAMKRDDALDAGVKLAQSFNLRSIKDLRNVAADELQRRSSGTGPIIDGFVVTDEPIHMLRSGKQHDVPLLVGSNSNEGGATTVSSEDFLKQSMERFTGLFDSFTKVYPGNNEEQAKASQLTLAPDSMAWRMWNWVDSRGRTAKSKAFIYTFARPAPPGDPEAGRAHHGAELPYVFHNLYLFHHEWADWDRELETIISSYWINFATTGDPNGGRLPQWPAYTTAQRDRVMMLGDKVEMGRSRLDEAKIALFDAYYDQMLSH